MYLFYVYAYLRKSDSTPYYIGKGVGNRAYNKHYNVTKPKDKSKIVLLETCLSEVGALALERRYIKWYGRKDIGTGILNNKTDGGEGVSGYKLSNPRSPEYRSKISAAHKGKTLTVEHRNQLSIANIGKKQTEETKEKISKKLTGIHRSDKTKEAIATANFGRPVSEETRLKMSSVHKGIPLSREHKDKVGLYFSSTKWWNNGTINKRAANCPGVDFVIGRIITRPTL